MERKINKATERTMSKPAIGAKFASQAGMSARECMRW
jgi:hypothetical protein